MKKELIIDIDLEYEPFLESSKQGTCQMSCPLGDCIITVNLNNSLKRVRQVVNIKANKLSICTK